MNCLCKDDLRQISGVWQRHKIVAWLIDTKIPYITDAKGWPVVAESAISAKLGASIKNEPRLNLA